MKKLKEKLVKGNIGFYYWLLRSYPMRRHFPKLNILSTSESINEIITNKKSISRFGDGEFRLLMQERSIYFQPLTIDLAERLQEVVNSCLPNLLLAIPGTFKSLKNIKRDPKIHWLNFINLYGKSISVYLNKNITYGDALISRFYMDYKNKNHVNETVNHLKKMWHDRNVLFVEGEFSRLGVGNDLFDNAKSIKRIICPSSNAFDKYEEIFSVSKKYGENKLIIIALGPTATVLAYDLAKENYWALDLGHIDIEYSWFLQKAHSKVAVKGKKSAEVNGNESFELSDAEEKIYKQSIIAEIS